MKKMIFSMMILASSSALATDWEVLGALAPSLKQESVSLDDVGLVKLNMVKLPSGKSRLVSVSSFLANKKPVLTISADSGKNLQALCSESVMMGKTFKAQLVVLTNPLKTNPRPFLGPDLSSFENPAKLGPAKIKFVGKVPNWTRYDRDAVANSKGRLLTDYYEDLLNAQAAQSEDGIIKMDLSDRNTLACDLASGTLSFETTRVLEYEKGLPEETNWVSIEQFTGIFQNFWKTKSRVEDINATAQQKEIADAVVLGIATQKAQLGDELLSSAIRLNKFISSVKTEVRGLNATQNVSATPRELSQNWSLNKEYSKPAEVLVRQEVVVGEEPVFVKYGN